MSSITDVWEITGRKPVETAQIFLEAMRFLHGLKIGPETKKITASWVGPQGLGMQLIAAGKKDNADLFNNAFAGWKEFDRKGLLLFPAYATVFNIFASGEPPRMPQAVPIRDRLTKTGLLSLQTTARQDSALKREIAAYTNALECPVF